MFVLSNLVVFFCLPLTTQAQQRALLEKRVSELVACYTWPENKVPTIDVVLLSKAQSDKKGLQAASIQLPLHDEQATLLVNQDAFENSTDLIRDFVVAHEIAHYHQLLTEYMPVLLRKKYIQTKKQLVGPADLNSHGAVTRSCSLVATLCFSNTLLGLFLQRNIELDADKRAAYALKSCSGGFAFFDHWIKMLPQRKSCRMLSLLDTWLSTHPTDFERKKNLKNLLLLHTS